MQELTKKIPKAEFGRYSGFIAPLRFPRI